MHCGQDVGVVATDAQRQQQIARLPQRAHLARQQLGQIAIVGHGVQQRSVARQGHGRQFGALALKTGDAKGGKLLRVRA